MKLLIRRIPETESVFEFVLSRDQIRPRMAGRPDITGFTEARVNVRCARVGLTVNLRGEATLKLQYLCSRCGNDSEAVWSLPIRHVLSPRGGDRRAFDEDEGVGYHNGQDIDLDEVALEQIAVAIPEQLLCRPECKGICPVCLANLNEEPCRCGVEKNGEKS
ncbi:MAG: DUF177 domain-containing protein [Myxococcales bacterium]|nr:DUF177 domain-containing protein [Myxococcales bacterium]